MCHSELSFPVTGGAGIREDNIDIPGEGVTLPTHFLRPEEGKSPGVLIIHDVFGASDFYQDFARRLANEGFAAVLPDFFVRQGPLPGGSRDEALARANQLDEPTTMKDIALTVRWLQQHDETTSSVGVVGFCMGGTLALLSAGRKPLPAAVVAYYGFPTGRKGWPDRPMDEIEKLQAPVLAFWGDQDQGVGMDNVAAYEEATQAAGKTVETVIYPGLPHGFLTFEQASPNFENSQDSWRRMLAFFRSHLSQ